MKGEKSTSTRGWKRRRIHVVSSNGVIGVLGTNARHNCVYGGGVGFRVNSKHLQKVKMNVLIVCSFYNVSQSPPMY
jgi:hypothetical protein